MVHPPIRRPGITRAAAKVAIWKERCFPVSSLKRDSLAPQHRAADNLAGARPPSINRGQTPAAIARETAGCPSARTHAHPYYRQKTMSVSTLFAAKPARLGGSSDQVHLAHAIRDERAILTRNYRDFKALRDLSSTLPAASDAGLS
jgi:hypothetical protein